MTVSVAAPVPAPEQAPEQPPAATPPESPTTPEKTPEPPPPPTKEQTIADAAEKLSSGDYDGALAAFDRAAPAVSEDPGVALLKASVLNSAGRIEEARKIAAEIARLQPKNAEALYVLATIEGNAGKEKQSKELLERTIALNPRHADALAALGNISMRAKVYKNAEAYFDRSLASDPDNREALIGKARVRRRMDDPKQAEAALNTAIDAYPDWPMPLVERARLYREQGYPEHALSDLNDAKRIAPNDYWIAIELGKTYVDMLEKPEALAEFERATAIDPGHFLAYAYSSGIREELEQWEAAERDYAKLAELKNDYFYAFEALGVLRMRDGRWDSAADAFIEAYKRAPTRPQYALLISLAWMRGGRAAEVRPFLAKVLPTVRRESLEYLMLRLYHDQSGDTDVAVRIDAEQNRDNRARMLYYLAQYYAAKGNAALAQRYHLQVRALGRQGMVEWRLNEWALEGSDTKR